MNPTPDPRLEAWTDRQLKSLPELRAPHTLAPRIRAALAAQSAALPARGWQAWPVGLRLASMVGLTLLFAALCLGVWRVTQSTAVTDATQQVTGFFALLSSLAGALEAVLGALAQATKKLGPVWLTLIAVVVTAGWISCLGLGTALARLAWTRR
jgi:predicted lysophospholipase L1 biosynthesis ABC-type transport system permease subunit